MIIQRLQTDTTCCYYKLIQHYLIIFKQIQHAVTTNFDLESHYLVCFSYEPNPESELAKLRLAAEEGWLSLGHDVGVASHIFRLGGIYGPGRRLITSEF